MFEFIEKIGSREPAVAQERSHNLFDNNTM
jgi:hypothetical protein